jgi:hypothetical protein
MHFKISRSEDGNFGRAKLRINGDRGQFQYYFLRMPFKFANVVLLGACGLILTVLLLWKDTRVRTRYKSV